MSKHQTGQYPLDPALDPDSFFPGTIVKADVVKWETELKKVLLFWLQRHDSPFLAVQRDLSPVLKRHIPDQNYGTGRTLELLVDLRKHGALPALIFLYDRSGCQKSVMQIVDLLRASEEQWKATSPEWAKTLAAFEKHNQCREKAQKRAAKASKKVNRGNRNDGDDDSSKFDAMREAASQEHNRWGNFDPDAPLDTFSLANHAKLARSELDTYIQKMKYVNLPQYIIEGLRRGVAVHHSGMNRKYLQT